MSQTKVKELTIGAKQALLGNKRRRGLIGGWLVALSGNTARCSKGLKVIATQIVQETISIFRNKSFHMDTKSISINITALI